MAHVPMFLVMLLPKGFARWALKFASGPCKMTITGQSSASSAANGQAGPLTPVNSGAFDVLLATDRNCTLAQTLSCPNKYNTEDAASFLFIIYPVCQMLFRLKWRL